MKQKYLLSMLVGGAMLTACSVDDDLNLSPVVEGVDSAAPVFTVSFDDEDPLTRAKWGESGKKVTFENKDLLSLYYGGVETSGYGNAIYKGTEGEDGKLTFNTSSMVTKGTAIMIYPADTTMSWSKNTGAPVIKVSNVQDKNTKISTPYMSEILTIKEWTDMGEAEKAGKTDEANMTEGYGRQYDIIMKRAADILSLKLVPTELKLTGVPDIDIKGVEFVAKSAVFTTEIAVTAASGVSVNKANDYKLWTGSSTLDVENIITKEKNLSTIDVDKATNIATFTLLPAKDFDFGEDGIILVHTTYGDVTIDKTTEKVCPNGNPDTKDEKPFLTAQEMVNFVMGRVWTKNNTATNTFYNEYLGKHITGLEMNVDLKKVEMSGMHVENEDELMVALKVYRQLKPEGDVNLILDGAKEGTYEGEFFMSEETWKEVAKELADDNSKISLSLCNGDHACSAVVLESKEAAAEEVPELQIKGYAPLTTTTNQTTPVKVRLVGNWTYNCPDDNPTTATKDESKKDLTGIGTLSVQDSIVFKNNVNAANNIEIIIEKTAGAGVSGTVTLGQALTNHGEIWITEGTDKLTVAGGGKLENREATGSGVDGFSVGGKIYNAGTLAIVDGTGGKIDNYGLIKVTSENARTLISNNGQYTTQQNATAETLFKTQFSSNNRIGTIELFDNEGSHDNTSVDGQQGFIKWFVSETVTADNTGSIANYIVIKGNCTSVESIGEKVKYLEINNNTGKEVVFNNDEDLELDGLIVRQGKSANIPKSTTLTTEVLYLKGEITKAGTFTYNNSDTMVGYYGGDIKDKGNIYSKK